MLPCSGNVSAWDISYDIVFLTKLRNKKSWKQTSTKRWIEMQHKVVCPVQFAAIMQFSSSCNLKQQYVWIQLNVMQADCNYGMVGLTYRRWRNDFWKQHKQMQCNAMQGMVGGWMTFEAFPRLNRPSRLTHIGRLVRIGMVTVWMTITIPILMMTTTMTVSPWLIGHDSST